MLRDILVLDMTDGVASFSSRLLADLGATVIKIEGPEGNPARKAAGEGTAFLCHNTNKLGVLLDLNTPEGNENFLTLISSADIMIEGSNPGMPESKDLEAQKLRFFNPRLIHISMAGSDHCRSCHTAAILAANAAITGLRKRRLTGNGFHVELCTGLDAADMEEGRTEDFPIFKCSEGYIQIPVFRNWDTLIELLSAESMAADLLDREWQQESYRESHRRHVLDLVDRWTRKHTREELFELGQSMGFPWAQIATFRDVLESPQLKARGFLVPVSMQERTVPVPGLPYKLSGFSPPAPRPAPSLGEHNGKLSLTRGTVREVVSPYYPVEDRNVLKGIRVLDLTRMISGPFATRLLADSGAEVIKIQSRITAHGAEQNDTPAFAIWNRNKRSITLNLGQSEARALFLELVAISDVVVENFSPRVMHNWELDYDRLRAVKQDLIMASISAMGGTGPWKNYVGFAPTFHALSGLTFASAQSPDVPQDVGRPYGDVITGLYAAQAILAAIEHRSASGNGQHIDLSAYEAVCTVVGPALIAASVGKDATSPGLMNRCYRCALSDSSKAWPGVDQDSDGNPAPSLGEANHYVFRELLGCSESEYRSLLSSEIIR